MPIIKKSDFKTMNESQLNERLTELKKELMKINTQIAMGTTPENPGRVRTIKKTIARIMGYNSKIKNEKGDEKPGKKEKEEIKKQ